MKFIKIFFLMIVSVALIACMGAFLFFQTFDTDQYLPQVIKKASVVLGRPVTIGHLSLGLSLRGFTLDAGPLIIADDQNFTKQPFIKVDRVRVSLDLQSLILKHEIRITHILLQSPQIHFIHAREGNFNIHSLGVQDKPSTNTVDLIAGNSVNPKNNSSPTHTPDKAQSSPLKPEAYLENNPGKSIAIQDASVSYIDQNQTMPLDLWLKNINLKFKNFSTSKPFWVSFNASFYHGTPNVYAKGLVFVDVLKHFIQFSGLSVDADMSQLDMDQLKYVSPGMEGNSVVKNIKGTVQINFTDLDIDGSGNVTATGNIAITHGIIKDFNIVRTILSQTLGNFGGMSSVNNLLNGPLKSSLGAEDTLVEKAQAQFTYHDKTIFIDDAVIDTNIFEITAKGTLDQAFNMDMQTMLHLNADVSAALVNQMDGLKYFYDDSKRIAIGGNLKGIIPRLKYKPNKDFRKKSMKVFMQEGGNILGLILGSIHSSDPDQDVTSSNPAKKKKKSLKDIFRNL